MSKSSARMELEQAEKILIDLAQVFQTPTLAPVPVERDRRPAHDPNQELKYKALLEQIPAVVYMAYLDRGIAEAYISPQIEELVGFSREEWLEDPVRWYSQIHPDDKQRWSLEVAQLILRGEPLKSAYRVVARDGRVVWFHCQAKMIRREDGRPWFVHGVACDITQQKDVEQALQEERNVIEAILDTVGALVVVLDSEGRIIRLNRACEQTSGYRFEQVRGKHVWDFFWTPEDAKRFRRVVQGLRTDPRRSDLESHWLTQDGRRRLVSWTCTALQDTPESSGHIILTGVDITERKRLEKEVLEASTREQRRIGLDLHDGLGQDLTGVAFMSKVLARKLAAKSLPEVDDAAKIVRLVNEAIQKTKELGRGLLPFLSESDGLMTALRQWAREVENLFEIECRFECDSPVLIADASVATHLYYVAQEAMTNAIKHGDARHIRIRLACQDGSGRLEVLDDGKGFNPDRPGRGGMGLHIMNYRAGMIGGSLEIHQGKEGTVVRCRFPLAPESH